MTEAVKAVERAERSLVPVGVMVVELEEERG